MGDNYDISQIGQGHQVVIQKGENLKARLGNIRWQEGEGDLSERFASLIDQVASSDDLSANQKREILEVIDEAEVELERPIEERSNSRIGETLEKAAQLAVAAAPIVVAINEIASRFA